METIWNFIKLHPEITVIGTFTLIQIAPIKINPWSWLVGLIHKFLFGKIDEKLDNIARKVDVLDDQMKEEKAITARRQILRFSDELYNGVHHSKEYFNEVLGEVDRYEKYCQDHPEFTNNKTVMSTRLIKETYNRLMENHGFE